MIYNDGGVYKGGFVICNRQGFGRQIQKDKTFVEGIWDKGKLTDQEYYELSKENYQKIYGTWVID
jgi:hypothetical protein